MYQQAMDAQDKAKASTEQQTVAMQLQNDAAGLLKMTLDGLNGKAISAAQAQNSFDSALANMGDHINATGKKIHFTTTNIGDMSAASVALRGQLNTQVQGLQAVVEANGGLDESTGKAREQMETMRQQIIDNAVAHGVDKDAVTAYVDNLLTIPKTVPPTKLQIDKDKAEADIAAFQAHVDAIHGKTVDLITRESTQKTADTLGTRTDPVTGEQSTYVSTPGGAEAPGSGTGTATKGTFLGYATGGQVSYLASGGHPGGPRGTDTVPAWLTPGEIVMKRASVESLGAGNLLYANKTGQWPDHGGKGSQPVTVNLILDGKVIDTRIVDVASMVASSAIGAANQDANRRPNR
jgi:predicted ester cyclase